MPIDERFTAWLSDKGISNMVEDEREWLESVFFVEVLSARNGVVSQSIRECYTGILHAKKESNRVRADSIRLSLSYRMDLESLYRQSIYIREQEALFSELLRLQDILLERGQPLVAITAPYTTEDRAKIRKAIGEGQHSSEDTLLAKDWLDLYQTRRFQPFDIPTSIDTSRYGYAQLKGSIQEYCDRYNQLWIYTAQAVVLGWQNNIVPFDSFSVERLRDDLETYKNWFKNDLLWSKGVSKKVYRQNPLPSPPLKAEELREYVLNRKKYPTRTISQRSRKPYHIHGKKSDNPLIYMPPSRYIHPKGAEIEVPYGFYMGQRLVSQALFSSVTQYNPSYFRGENRPVECVSYFDALLFCNLLSARDGYTPVYQLPKTLRFGQQNQHLSIAVNDKANGYRIPTEAHWLCAAYAESLDPFQIWYRANSNLQSRDVATRKPNRLGFYDLFGNVWEWCSDLFLMPDQSAHLTRGGSWSSDSDQLEQRIGRPACEFSNALGMRVLRIAHGD